MEILLLLGLILLNGLFAMTEIALIAARKSRLQRQANAGDSSAQTALRQQDPAFEDRVRRYAGKYRV